MASDQPSNRHDGGSDRERGAQPQQAPRTAAEWVSLALSAAIVLALAAAVGYLYLARGDRPPEIVVTPQVQSAARHGDGFAVPVTLVNRGDQAAIDVSVRLELTLPDGRAVHAETRADVLAGGATSHHTAVFREDPRLGRVTVTSVTFATSS